MSDSSKETNCNSCCSVEAVVSVDDRGQMVLPKEIRAKAGIKPGDKVALICLEKDGKVCCITMLKADNLSSMVMQLIKPAIENT